MKFQTRNLIFVMDAQTDRQTDGQAQSNMPIQLFQRWGHKDYVCLPYLKFSDLLPKAHLFF